jgi:spermidine synthase
LGANSSTIPVDGRSTVHRPGCDDERMSATARRLGLPLAGLLAFLSAGSVLVLEIAAGRLLAPYVGVSLTTYTGIIGVILAGIALGAWVGGRAADLYGPLPLLGPTFILGGIGAMASIPIVDAVGAAGMGEGIGAIVLLSAIGFALPATTLSAIAPMVVRATIVDIATSGSLVGRLSAAGTLGAISGTFVTGFFLLGTFPTRTIILATGVLLVLVGLGLVWWSRPRGVASADDGPGPGITLAAVLVGLAVVGGAVAVVPNPCERESAYYCIRVVEGGSRESGRTLMLDQLRHAYVDLDDPNYLEFAYIRWFDLAVRPVADRTGGDFDGLHLGGGGFTFPRHLAAAYPHSHHTILELDPIVHATAVEELGLEPSPSLDIVLGDARPSVERLPADAYDVVMGDAFGSLSVPWHLTTDEFLGELDRVLRPGGRYVMNLIDGPDLGFVRAETKTVASRFESVAVMARPGAFDGIDGGPGGGGNVVIVASHEPIDTDSLAAAAEASALRVRIVTGDDLAGFIGNAPFLRDDYAPVDQLIGR